MKYTHVIWDFNGTILDDLVPSVESTNKMLKERGIPEFKDIEEYRRVFNFPVKDYYEKIGFDFNKTPYDVLAKEWFELYTEGTKDPKLMPGVKKTCDKFKEAGIIQTVISACESNILKRQLKELGVYDYFDEILGLDNIHAGGKGEVAREWRKRNKGAKAVFIGDTVHDAEVAKIAEADCLLYLGGHHDKERLSACGKTFKEFSEIIPFVIG